MSRDNDGATWLLIKMMAPLVTDCFFWRAERRTSFVPISEATLVPAAMRRVSSFIHEYHVARASTVAVQLSIYRAFGVADNWLRPGAPRAHFE